MGSYAHRYESVNWPDTTHSIQQRSESVEMVEAIY